MVRLKLLTTLKPSPPQHPFSLRKVSRLLPPLYLLSNNEVSSSFNYVSSIYKSSLLTTSHPRTRPRLAIVATALASKTKQVHFPFLCEGVVNFLLSATIRGCHLKKRGHYNIIRPLTFFQTRSMDQIVALTTDKLPCPTVSD